MRTVHILHRQYIRSCVFKDSFDKELKRMDKDKSLKKSNSEKLMIDPIGVFMCAWYAFLYSVIEGLKGRDVKVDFAPTLDSELEGILKGFRNAVFHSPSDYWDKRLIALFAAADAGRKIRKVHQEIGDAFLKRYKS